MPRSTRANVLRRLGFRRFEEPLTHVTGELLFAALEAPISITFAIDESGQQWIHVSEAVDLTPWGFEPLLEMAVEAVTRTRLH